MTSHFLSKESGVQSALFYANPNGDAYQAPHLPPLKRFETDRSLPVNYQSVASQLDRVGKEQSIDIMHIHGIWSPLVHFACRYAFDRGIPYIVAPRGMLEPWALRQKRVKKWLALWWYQRRDLNRARCIHATAQSEATSVQMLGIATDIEVIPNGTEIPESLSRKPSNERKRVLFLSRIHPKKGLVDLIAAWSQIRPRGWECVIAGTDEDGYSSEVKAAIDKNGLENVIRMHPSVDGHAKWELYRSADLFVLPSHSENFGLVIAEALASGVPVVTTTQTPWEELISHRCGWWIQDNPTALAAALREAMSLSDFERDDMGSRGRDLIQRKYTWPAVASKLASLYRDVLEGTKRSVDSSTLSEKLENR